MLRGDEEMEQVVRYMKAHWPSKVKEEWQVDLLDHVEITRRVVADFTKGKSFGRRFVRLAGLSGSGKTTQLLPAAEAYFEVKGARPVLVAARRFVEYHPHRQEILDFYGSENLRKMTDEFATIMMFLVLKKLCEMGVDMILDVTLLDPKLEAVLVEMLSGHEKMMLMTVVAPEVVERFLEKRTWRHTKETEREFVRATKLAFLFYMEKCPGMRVVLWNAYEEAPVFDREIAGAREVFLRYMKETKIPEHDEEVLRRAKVRYLREMGV